MTAAQPLFILDRVTIELLNAIARTVPKLKGAACREPRARAVFDRTAHRGVGMLAARREAIAICRTCPVLQQCRRYHDSLDSNARPFGVVGGAVNPPKDITFAPRRRRTRG